MTKRQIKALAIAHLRAALGHGEKGNRGNHLARLDRLARLQVMQTKATSAVREEWTAEKELLT
jgi:hypothetical protein